MSLKQVKNQIASLRDEIGRQGGREWITVKMPVGFTDERIADWLVRELGADWRRHVIVRMSDARAMMPAIVERVPVDVKVGTSQIVFTAEESALA